MGKGKILSKKDSKMEVNKLHPRENSAEKAFPELVLKDPRTFFKELTGKDPGELADRHSFYLK